MRLAVQDLIPDSVEFIGFVVVRDRESVGSFVTSGVLIVKTRSSVERLMQVTDIVDKQTKSVRSSSIVVSRVEPVLNIVIHVGLLVPFAVLTREPVCDIIDSCHDVVGWNHIRSRVIGSSLARLINKGIINEVEALLPHTSMVLNIVSKGGTLDERVASLMASQIGIKVPEGH